MPILLEFVRPHGWLPLVAILIANGALCFRFGRRVLLITIPLVGIAYGVLDVAWIQSEMAEPEWEGQPDQDAIFIIGVIVRGAVATILLFMTSVPVAVFSALGDVSASRRPRRA